MTACLLMGLLAPPVSAQSSSLMRWSSSPAGQPGGSAAGVTTPGASGFAAMPPREESRAGTRAVEAVSLIAVPRMPPRKFKVEDLITVIVRQQKKYEADAKLDTKKQWDIAGKLNEWFRLYPGLHLGEDQLSNGDPGFDFKFQNRLKSDGDSEREDKFITRIQAKVIDVKPNGNLVLEAKQTEMHDEEEFDITLTGVCRSEDVTPDNAILSTQIAELVLQEQNTGAVRDATRRGWAPRILDWARPF